jgi:hypothetical protein
MNFMVAPKPGVDQIKILKGFDVNRILLVCMVAAQNPVQLSYGLKVVMTMLVKILGVNGFIGMGVEKSEFAGWFGLAEWTCQCLFGEKKGCACKKRGFEKRAPGCGKTH